MVKFNFAILKSNYTYQMFCFVFHPVMKKKLCQKEVVVIILVIWLQTNLNDWGIQNNENMDLGMSHLKNYKVQNYMGSDKK